MMASLDQLHYFCRTESDGAKSTCSHPPPDAVTAADSSNATVTEKPHCNSLLVARKTLGISDTNVHLAIPEMYPFSVSNQNCEATEWCHPMKGAQKEVGYEEASQEVLHTVTHPVQCQHQFVVFSDSLFSTTLALLSIQKELPQEQFFALYSDAKELNCQSNKRDNSLTKFLDEKHIPQSSGDKVVMLIDHYSKRHLLSDSVLYRLLNKEYLPHCVIILGIHEETSCEWESATKLKLAFRTKEEDCADLLNYFNASPDIVRFILENCIDICSNIELVKIILELYDKAPETLATMVEAIVLKRMNSEAKCLNALTTRLHNKFMSLCKLAYLSIDDRDGIEYQDVSKCVTLDEHNGAFSSMKTVGMGLLICPQSAEETGVGKCFFIHDLLKDFMIAYYVSHEPLLCQISIFKLNSLLQDSEHQRLSMLYFSMNRIQTKTVALGKVSKSELPYVYSCLLMSISLDYDSGNETFKKICYIYKLLHQSQNPELIHKLFSKRFHELTLKLTDTTSLDSLAPVIQYVISHSGISEWVVSTHSGLSLTADFISLSIKRISSGKIRLKINIIEDDVFIIQPTLKKAVSTKSTASDCTYVKCLREVIHRILQLFSPVKIKSSSSESSYISFLACNCLKEKLEENQLLHFEPIQAFHWLKSSISKQSLKKRNKNSREALEFEEHMASYHNMEQAELVIMVAPLPERIYYLEPHSSIKRCIELYKNKDELFFKKPIIERSNNTFVDFKECFDDTIGHHQLREVVQAKRSDKSMMVAPLLPIPKSNINTSYDHPSPKFSEAPIYNIASKGLSNFGKPLGSNPPESGFINRYGMMNAPKTQLQVKPLEEKYAASYVATETTVLQESSRSRAQVQRQVAVEPGTVLYSTMPNVFTVDMRYPCPDENRLIKKGGNGAIYSTTYGQYEFAVKKTPYRSREIEVHKMLKHPNIVELKCLMFGHQQPEFKRRYFSYHFMSKYNGDLSRLVTNKPELTMVNLSEKYKGNPRLLGSVQGNWKFILKEVLKGLAYMHSHGVIHRDIKASNILIKQFCTCENLLTCTCQFKYSVCIADFDAAVILDANNGIPPTSVSNHQRVSPSQKQVYQVIPVGTDGYRAPESAQVVVSNDLSILDPPLTVKADIWSVGLILIRMLNGATGPNRQQKLSTLLLYYHQTKQGNIKKHYGYQYHPGPQFPIIQKSEVDGIIGLTKFNEVGNTWIRKAVDCIAKCVEIDPEKRPTAESLLRDTFLY